MAALGSSPAAICWKRCRYGDSPHELWNAGLSYLSFSSLSLPLVSVSVKMGTQSLGYDCLSSEIDLICGRLARPDGLVSKAHFLQRVVTSTTEPPPPPPPAPPAPLPKAVEDAKRGMADLVQRLQRNVGPRGRDAVQVGSWPCLSSREGVKSYCRPCGRMLYGDFV